MRKLAAKGLIPETRSNVSSHQYRETEKCKPNLVLKLVLGVSSAIIIMIDNKQNITIR